MNMFIGDFFLKSSGILYFIGKKNKFLSFGLIMWTEVQSDIDILSSKECSLLMSYQILLLCYVRKEKKKVLHEKTKDKAKNFKNMKI